MKGDFQLNRYDSIIVGAGHNGLVCAAYLARKGQRVLVLEASDTLGGLAATREFHSGFKASVAHTVSHFSAIHEIRTNPSGEPQPVTLLELIAAVSEVSESEQETLATVTYMLNSGRVRLSGSFRDTPVTKLCG